MIRDLDVSRDWERCGPSQVLGRQMTGRDAFMLDESIWSSNVAVLRLLISSGQLCQVNYIRSTMSVCKGKSSSSVCC